MELLKQDEVTLMKNSKLNTIETNVKNLNQPIKWLNSWDFVSGLQHVTFKTLMSPPVQAINNSFIEIKDVDLRPLLNKTMYKVKIKRF
jgi:uncharacterized iron-regulated protein